MREVAEVLAIASNRDLEEFVRVLEPRTRDWLADNMGDDIRELKDELESRESEICYLEEEVADLRDEIRGLHARIEELESERPVKAARKRRA
jgi:phage shock protein A